MSNYSKKCKLLPLLILTMIIATSRCTRGVEIKPFTLSHPQTQLGDTKVLAALGLVCQCCDGKGGECRGNWDGSCSSKQLQCQPWKYHRSV